MDDQVTLDYGAGRPGVHAPNQRMAHHLLDHHDPSQRMDRLGPLRGLCLSPIALGLSEWTLGGMASSSSGSQTRRARLKAVIIDDLRRSRFFGRVSATYLLLKGHNFMIKRLFAGAAVIALSAMALPAQALTEVTPGDCGDGAGWTWSVSNPARYLAGEHEVVVGLSEARRTFTIHTPAGCTFDEGDTWEIYNGYFNAEGTISATEDGNTSDTDTVNVEVPTSNAVAGDELIVHLRVSDPDTPGWEVDKSTSVPRLTLQRRALFKYQTIDNRINFAEPYQADEPVRSGGALIRASWTSKAYYGYEGRNVHIQWRPDVAGSTYSDVQTVTTGPGGTVRSSFVVSDPGGPNPGDTFIVRAKYYGNGTTSGNHSTGDRIAPAS